MVEDLSNIRRDIDALDAQLRELLLKRLQLAFKAGEIKKSKGMLILDPVRENAIRKQWAAIETGFQNITLEPIMAEIISASRQIQQPLQIAFLGPLTTFSHQAAITRFGSSVEWQPALSISQVFSSVEKGAADFGVVPIENSFEGSVNETFDCLWQTPLYIIGELSIPIVHHLLSQSKMDSIQTIYSHPQALAQCRAFTTQHLPLAQVVAVSSTAVAAQKAAAEPFSAAIASELAATMYQLPIQQSNISDSGQNTTRFLVIGKKPINPVHQPKTSMVFMTLHQPGALVDALQVLRDHGVNMTLIESRPAKRENWHYWFFVDVEGNKDQEPLSKAIVELQSKTQQLRCLGSYENLQS